MGSLNKFAYTSHIELRDTTAEDVEVIVSRFNRWLEGRRMTVTQIDTFDLPHTMLQGEDIYMSEPARLSADASEIIIPAHWIKIPLTPVSPKKAVLVEFERSFINLRIPHLVNGRDYERLISIHCPYRSHTQNDR